MMESARFDSQYDYQTESYDFRPYMSMDTDNQKSEMKGFKYNSSIVDDKSVENSNVYNQSALKNDSKEHVLIDHS